MSAKRPRFPHEPRPLTVSARQYRTLFRESGDAIYMAGADGLIAEVNAAAVRLFGREEQDLVGSCVSTLFGDPEEHARFRDVLATDGSVRDFEALLLRGDGDRRWCLLTAWLSAPAADAAARRAHQAIIHDISARKAREDRLAHGAFHDPLTGLPNRALFMDRLERAVARRRRGDERELAVLFLDLDRFKVVNDSLGHTVGDQVLKQVAALLREQVRQEDTVARMGGDEFAILLDGIDDAGAATHVAERVQDRLRSPLSLGDRDVFTSASIGITFARSAASTPDALLRDADTAMYRAKELGPARYQIFDEGMHARAVALLQLETDLRRALERDEFVVHYQPVLDLEQDRLTGFEALVRWEHPQKGLILPSSFIPVAEDTGIIVPLGAWVLRRATEQMRHWQQQDPERADLFISVNLSARQFSHPELAAMIQATLSETGLDGPSLRLELTESVVMASPQAAVRTFDELRRLGVSLCIDDFGTGYSALHYLHTFPIDTLKIDRSFISRLADDDGTELVRTILGLARALGLHAVAEGVETVEQLERLRAFGHASIQGFLFSRPLDVDAASTLLDQHRPPANR